MGRNVHVFWHDFVCFPFFFFYSRLCLFSDVKFDPVNCLKRSLFSFLRLQNKKQTDPHSKTKPHSLITHSKGVLFGGSLDTIILDFCVKIFPFSEKIYIRSISEFGKRLVFPTSLKSNKLFISGGCF